MFPAKTREKLSRIHLRVGGGDRVRVLPFPKQKLDISLNSTRDEGKKQAFRITISFPVDSRNKKRNFREKIKLSPRTVQVAAIYEIICMDVDEKLE